MLLFISATIENFHVVETLADNAIIIYQTHKVMILSYVPKDASNSDSNIQICYSKFCRSFNLNPTKKKTSKEVHLFVCLQQGLSM